MWSPSLARQVAAVLPPARAGMRGRAITATLLISAAPIAVSAQTTFRVTDQPTLATAITSAASGDTIVFANNITLTSDLPSIATDLTIDGGGFTLSGASQHRGLTVAQIWGPWMDVTIQNLTIANTVARGGDGGSGAAGGGGGGAGLGGALYVAEHADVTLRNVAIVSSSAIGGDGGAAIGAAGGGGGGGVGGSGGPSGAAGGPGGGGGGGFGSAASGGGALGGPGILTGALPNNGGGGSATGSGGYGGGANGGSPFNGRGGVGGYGGGGGGGTTGWGADGGFGGGGGGGGSPAGRGGFGGFGGGTSSALPSLATSEFGGGPGGTAATGRGGGGGAALGGAIFVEDNSWLTIGEGVSINGSTVTGGAGATGAGSGGAYGSGIFLEGGDPLRFDIAASKTTTISDAIADRVGATGDGTTGYYWWLNKLGDGKLVLSGINKYAGGTNVYAGTLSVASNENLGVTSAELNCSTGPLCPAYPNLVLRGTSTLEITGSNVFARDLELYGTPTISVGSGLAATWSGPIWSDSGVALRLTGGGSLTLTDAGNSYSGGTFVTGGSTVVVSADGALGVPGTGVTLGDASSAGTLAITTNGAFSSSRPFTLGAGGGIFNTAATANATLSGVIGGPGGLTKNGAGSLMLTGWNTYAGATTVNAGTLIAGSFSAFGSAPSLAINPAGTVDFGGYDFSLGTLSGTGTLLLSNSTGLTVGASNVDSSFGGTIGGTGSLTKSGTGTLFLSGSNSYSGGTSINAGTLSISSNANLGSGSVTMFNASTLAITGSDTYTHDTSLSETATFLLAPGVTAAWNGTVSDYFQSLFSDTGPTTSLVVPGGLNVTGGGTLALGNANNTYSLGTAVTGNSTVSVSADGALGASGGRVTLGDTSSSGTLAVTTAGTFSSSRPFSLGAGGGTIDTAAGTAATLTGVIDGAGGLTKGGAGTLTLSGANTYAGSTSVKAGTLFAGAANVFGSASTLVIGAFATVDFGGFSQSINSVSGTGNLLLSGGARITLGTNNADNSFGGTIGGTGGIVKNGTGTLTLSGSNSFSGGIAVNGGTLSVGSDAHLGGAGAVSMADATTLALTGGGTFAHDLRLAGNPLLGIGSGNAVTWSGLVSDGVSSGTMRVTGGGTLTLSNAANTYTGGTIVAGGSTVVVGADSALGAPGSGLALGNTTTSATLGINASSGFLSSRPITVGSLGATVDVIGGTNATLNGAISGAGGLTKIGTGTLTFGGANTYSGPTVATAGTLRAGATSAFGTSGSLTVASGATVDLNGFNQSFGSLSGGGTIALNGGASLSLGGAGSSYVFGGTLTGSGSLVKNGGGTLALTGSNSYGGGTTVNGGTLLGNTTSIQGDIVNNATVVFDQVANGTYSGSMSGTGSLGKTGPGSLTLAGTNSYGGGTLISSGTLIGNCASLRGPIVNHGTLIFDEAGRGTFNGTIFGTGALTKHGAGTLWIAGAHPFSGAVWINHGTLALNGGLGGDVNVASGASLRGAGTIGGSLNLGGSLFVPAPGTSAASFNAMRLDLQPAQPAEAPSLVINGDLTATPGSLLDVTVTPGGAAPIVVNGLATLTGTHVNVAVEDPQPARYATYVGLTSGGLTINGIDVSSPTPGIVPVLKYDPKSIFFTLLNENIPLGGVASTPNAAGVGGALDRLKPGMTGDLAFVVRELTALDTQSLNTTLRRLAGELHSSELRLTVDESVLMTDLVRAAIDDRDDEDDEAKRLTGLPTMRWWFQLTGEHARFTPAGFDSAIANGGGGAGGFDIRPIKGLTLGGGGSFSRAALSMQGLGGSSDLQAPRAFGYAGYKAGPFFFNGGGSTARTAYTTQRPIAFKASVPSPTGAEPLSGGIDRVADSEQTGVTRDTWTEWKDTVKRGSWTYDWKIGYRAATYDRNPFTETGAGSISLTGLAQVLKTKEADVNIHVFRRTGTWRPRVLVSYRRQLGDLNTSSGVQIGDQPAGQFIVDGVPLPQDEFHGIFGVTMRSAFGFEYTLEYETRIARDENHQGLHFRVRFR